MLFFIGLGFVILFTIIIAFLGAIIARIAIYVFRLNPDENSYDDFNEVIYFIFSCYMLVILFSPWVYVVWYTSMLEDLESWDYVILLLFGSHIFALEDLGNFLLKVMKIFFSI